MPFFIGMELAWVRSMKCRQRDTHTHTTHRRPWTIKHMHAAVQIGLDLQKGGCGDGGSGTPHSNTQGDREQKKKNKKNRGSRCEFLYVRL
jgi:hypothetical protein